MAAVLAVVAAAGLFGVAYAVCGAEATADNWVGVTVVQLLLAALLGSLAAFVLGVAARLDHESWGATWLPLSVLPALILFLALGETLWWE